MVKRCLGILFDGNQCRCIRIVSFFLSFFATFGIFMLNWFSIYHRFWGYKLLDGITFF